MKVARLYWLVLPAILLLPSRGSSELSMPVPAYIEATNPDQGNFSDLLTVEILKRHKRMAVVQSPNEAQLIVSANIDTRPTSRAKANDTEAVSRTEWSTTAAVFARDRCGRIVCGENTSGHSAWVAEHIAKALKVAIERRQSRLHRAKPCRPDRPSEPPSQRL